MCLVNLTNLIIPSIFNSRLRFIQGAALNTPHVVGNVRKFEKVLAGRHGYSGKEAILKIEPKIPGCIVYRRDNMIEHALALRHFLWRSRASGRIVLGKDGRREGLGKGQSYGGKGFLHGKGYTIQFDIMSIKICGAKDLFRRDFGLGLDGGGPFLNHFNDVIDDGFVAVVETVGFFAADVDLVVVLTAAC